MSDSTILTEISNPIRLNLLLLLYDNNYSISELKNKIGEISHSEISRHLGRLARHDLITKESIPGRKYEISHFGRTIMKLFKPINFILQHGHYFKTHRIDFIPESLLQGIDNLSKSELILGTGNLLTKGKTFMNLAKQLWVLTDDPFPYEITVKDVFLIIPPKMLKFGLEVNHEVTTYHVHTISEVHQCIIISDLGQGFIFFPSIDSPNPDFSAGFFVTEPQGIEYLKLLFDHFWDNSKEFVFKL